MVEDLDHSHEQQQLPAEYEYIRKEIRRDYKIEKEFFIDDIKYMVDLSLLQFLIFIFLYYKLN